MSVSNNAARYMRGCEMIEEKRQRQLKWGCELIGGQRHALRGAAAPCNLLSNSAARWWSPYDTPPLALPGAHERGDSFADRSHPRDGDVSI